MAQGTPHPQRRGLTRSRGTWFLLLTIPLAVVASFFLLVITTIAWCGISGCTGGGYGLVSDPDEALAIGASAVGGLLWFGAIAAPPWLRPLWIRLTVAAVIGVVMAALLLVWGTAGFVRA